MLTQEQQYKQDLKERFWIHVHLPWEPQNEDCWWWKDGLTAKGYGQMYINNKLTVRAHRLAYELFVGPIPKGMSVLHKCDVKSCVNHHHLFLGTRLDNALDCISKGRHSSLMRKEGYRGIIHVDRYPEVFAVRAQGLTFEKIASIFNASAATIHGIIHNPKNKHFKL